MEEQPVPTKRSREWVGWVVAFGVVLVIAGFVVPAVQKSRCEIQSLRESTALRNACTAMIQRQLGGREMPRSVAELFHDGSIDLGVLDQCTETDYSRVRIGKYSIRQIADRRMSLDELNAEIARVYPAPIAWERIGPLTMCLDARAYETPDSSRIVGWLTGGSEHGPWTNITFADQHVSLAPGADEQMDARMFNESLAFYESIGIPMPEEMVKELREAMEGK